MKFRTACLVICVACALVADDGWKVAPLNGAPALFHDGQPVPLVLYMPYWQIPPQDIKDVSAAGLHLYDAYASFLHYGNPYWKKDGSFGLGHLEDALDRLVANDPQAAFMPRLYSTAPDWWRDAHPEELIRFAGIPDMDAPAETDRRLRGPGYRKLGIRESFASQVCRDAVTPFFRKAVRRLVDKYGDRLAGVHVAGGPCGEHFTWDMWFDFPLGEVPPPYGDVSEPMRRAFAAYLRGKYGNDVARLRAAWKDPSVDFDTVQAPDKAAREAFDDTGVWRDPAKGRRVPDFLEALHATTADMIAHYCGVVKDESKGRLPTLVFYGYTQDEPWSCEADHRAVSRLYRSDAVDAYSAPHTYKRRRPGEDGGMRQYLASAALHGRLFIDEGDDMTYLERRKKHPDSRAYAVDLEQSLHLLYREFGQSVTHGVGLWYMDLQGGFFRDPVLVDAMGRMRKWGEAALLHPRGHHSEVAVVSNPESEFYMGARSTPANNVSMVAYLEQMGAFYSAGAPFDWYLADDLDAVVAARPKVVVFLDCQYLKPEQLAAVEKLKADGRTLVFFHAPGYVSEHDLSQARTERLTGFEMEVRKDEAPLAAVDASSGARHGSERTQRGLFLPKTRPSDAVLATGVGPLEGRPVAVSRAQKGWTGVHVAVPALSDAALHAVYRAAGVYLYTDPGVVLSANSAWIMLHARTAGTYEVRLPSRAAKVTEITSERSVGTDLDVFSWMLPRYHTAIFLVEP